VARSIPLGRRGVPVSGEVAFLRFTITTPDAEDESDLMIREFLEEVRNTLRGELKEAALETLGPEFDVPYVDVRRGSVTVLAVLTAGYLFIAAYKSFVDALDLFLSQARRIIHRNVSSRFDDRVVVSVSSRWLPGPALDDVMPSVSEPRSSTEAVLLFYLVLSHAALLAVLIWQQIR
jgi:hypothetical protein